MNRRQVEQANELRALVAERLQVLMVQERVPAGLCTYLEWVETFQSHLLRVWVDQPVLGWPQRHSAQYALPEALVDYIYPDALQRRVDEVLESCHAGVILANADRRYA